MSAIHWLDEHEETLQSLDADTDTKSEETTAVEDVPAVPLQLNSLGKINFTPGQTIG
jgi:hypothetical protein